MAALVLAVWPRPAGAQWMASAYLGGAHTGDAAVAIAQPARETDVVFEGVGFRSESLKSPPYYGYRLSYFLRARPRFGLEAEFVHAKVFARTGDRVDARGRVGGRAVNGPTPLDTHVQRFAMSHGLNFVFVNLVVRHPLGGASAAPRAWLQARAGAGVTVPHVETTIGGESGEGYQRGGPGAQAAGGAAVRLASRVHALAEYKVSWARESVEVPGGRARATLWTHHLALGVSWMF